MKQIVCLVLLFTLTYCEKTFLTDEDLKNQKPYDLKTKSETKILENGIFYLLAKDIGGGTNYYFSCSHGCKEFFLFLTCDVDCNEYIDLKEWNSKNNSFAVLIRSKYKANFKTQNRLILYKIVNNEPVELLDTVQEVYKTFRYEGADFIYTLENGTEKKISLN